MAEVTDLLWSLNTNVLKALTRRLGLAKTVTRKPDLIAELDRYLLENLRDLLSHLSEVENKVLVEAAYNNGQVEALLVEVADEATAALIAHDAQTGKHCRLSGGKHLAVPKRNYRAFRSAIKKMGFIIPDGQLPA